MQRNCSVRLKFSDGDASGLTGFSVGAVAEGALLYARNPVFEKQIARANIGLEYLDDHDADGNPFPGDQVEPGIGWIYLQVRARTGLVHLHHCSRLPPTLGSGSGGV